MLHKNQKTAHKNPGISKVQNSDKLFLSTAQDALYHNRWEVTIPEKKACWSWGRHMSTLETIPAVKAYDIIDAHHTAQSSGG
jgi:hypothetical protein